MKLALMDSKPRLLCIPAAAAASLVALLASETCQAASDNPLVYVPLAQACRLLDTRATSGGAGPLTQAHGNYLFYTDDAHIASATQNGNASGCGVPTGVSAISVNYNMLNAAAAGNIRIWSDDQGAAGPAAGSGVYNPSITAPQAGQVLYNAGYSNVAVGADGGFYIAVANGEIDMTINVTGYWRPIGLGVNAGGLDANATGFDTFATGDYSTAMGVAASANGSYSTAMGDGFASLGGGCLTTAAGTSSTALGFCAYAGGFASTAMGTYASATGDVSSTLGSASTASGYATTALGTNADTNGHSGSFAYGDYNNGSVKTTNDADNQFMVRASGGLKFYTSTGTAGAALAAGSGSWTTLSDRNAKDDLRRVDARDILASVVALPLNTWRYNTQDAHIRHMGPMAQDFYASFHLGESDTGIDTVDADGVVLAAIQGFDAVLAADAATTAARLDRLDREIVALDEELATQKDETAAQDMRIAALESLAVELADIEARLVALRQRSSAALVVR